MKSRLLLIMVFCISCNITGSNNESELTTLSKQDIEKSSSDVSYNLAGDENMTVNNEVSEVIRQKVVFRYNQTRSEVNSDLYFDLVNAEIPANDTSDIYLTLRLSMWNKYPEVKEYEVKLVSDENDFDRGSSYDGAFISSIQYNFNRMNSDKTNSWEQLRKKYNSSSGTVNISSIEEDFIEGDFDIEYNLDEGQQELWKQLGSSSDTTIYLDPKKNALVAKGNFKIEY